MLNKMKPSLTVLSSVLMAAAVLVGCAKKDEAAKPTQVIAQVNGTELSVHQLNFAMQGLQVPAGLPAEQLAKVRKSTLDKMIDQEALVQEAINKKVDRDPNVQQQLEAARKDILVRNHLQKIGSTVSPPNSEAVAKFYQENPELFKDRNIFQFAEIVLPRLPNNWPELEKALLPTKTLAQVVEVLRANNINAPVSQNVIRPAEDLPLETVKQITNLKDGEIAIYARPPAIVIAQITARKALPIEEAKATQAIEQFLSGKTRNEVAQAEVKRVHDAAKITYLGEFTGGVAPVGAPVVEKKVPSVAAPAMPATPVAPAPTPAMDAAAKESSKEVIEKGLKGLK